MMRSRRQLWLYPLFQVPLMLMAACLVLAALFWLLGLGRPPVAVAIALDLSSSTYGSVMQQEIAAVQSYVKENGERLKVPNQLQIFGFANRVQPLTNSFQTDSQQLQTEFNQSLNNPNLLKQLGGGTNLNQAIQEGTKALSTIEKRCRELLLVTDGQADVQNRIIEEATQRRVRINAVVVGSNAPELYEAANRTNGIYLDQVTNLEELFTDTFFDSFNSNLKWVIFWLGCAWVALMWTLTLPLDRWLFQGVVKLDMTLAGQLALGNAFFWSVLIPLLLWKVIGLPFGKSC